MPCRAESYIAVKEFILDRTQPSPCYQVTSHNYEPGNHGRSEADGSIMCLKPDLCHTATVHYMTETKLDLYTNCMADLKAAVRPKFDIPQLRRVAWSEHRSNLSG